MSARYVQGDSRLLFPEVVATAQAVESMDLVALQSNTIVRAADITWQSAVATPSNPTGADGAVAFATGLTNGATGVKISYQFPWGEGALSSGITVTPTANAAIKLTGASLVPPTPALWTNVYVETSAGSGTYKLYGKTQGVGTFFVLGYGAGRTPPTAVATDATALTQYTFAQLFCGVSNQRKIANLARIFGNSQDNVIMVNHGGVFEFDCASATFNRGDWVGPAKDTGNALTNQTVVAVASDELAIGRVLLTYSSNTTRVLVEVKSTLDPTKANAFSDVGVDK